MECQLHEKVVRHNKGPAINQDTSYNHNTEKNATRLYAPVVRNWRRKLVLTFIQENFILSFI